MTIFYVSICLYLSTYLYVYLYIYLYVYLSTYLYVYLSICLSVCLPCPPDWIGAPSERHLLLIQAPRNVIPARRVALSLPTVGRVCTPPPPCPGPVLWGQDGVPN
jgi:hypothetical protein